MNREHEELSEGIKALIDEVLQDDNYKGFHEYCFRIVLSYGSEREFFVYPSGKSQAITVSIVYDEDRTGIRARFKVKNITPLNSYILEGYNGEEINIEHKRTDSKDIISEMAIKEGIMSIVRFPLRIND